MLCVSCCLRREGVGPSTRFPSSRREEQFLCFALSGPKRSYSRNLGARSFSYKPLCSTEMPQLGDSPEIKELSGIEQEILWLPRRLYINLPARRCRDHYALVELYNLNRSGL